MGILPMSNMGVPPMCIGFARAETALELTGEPNGPLSGTPVPRGDRLARPHRRWWPRR